MKTIIRFTIITFIVCFGFLSFNCNSESNPYPVTSDVSNANGILADETIVDGNIKVYNYTKNFHVTIVSVPDTIHFLYFPSNPKSVESNGKEGDWRYLINSTYYSGPSTAAKHAGWLWIYGKAYESKSEDQQLTHVVCINRAKKDISFTYYKDFASEYSKDNLEFQTGPLVVENSKLAQGYISSSINGLRDAPRTLLATLDKKQAFFVISKSYVDLLELGNFLIKLSIFDGKRLDIVNLDGGPSTALYSKNVSRMNYNSDAALPLLLGIK